MITIGTEVGWQWGNGIATGTVEKVVPERHVITSKGKTIVRNGTRDDPALVIRHSSASLVLKLQHEVQQLHVS